MKIHNYKGGIKNFPPEVVHKMLERQYEQHNTKSIKAFESSKQSGFTWRETPEGFDFWHQVIGEENFNAFFDRYPKYKECIPVKELPYPLQELIKQRQIDAGNDPNLDIFDTYPCANTRQGGFDWSDTLESRIDYEDYYWAKIFNYNNYDNYRNSPYFNHEKSCPNKEEVKIGEYSFLIKDDNPQKQKVILKSKTYPKYIKKITNNIKLKTTLKLK